MNRSNFGQILDKITNAIVGVFDIADLEKRIVRVSQDIFNAEASSLFLVDDDRKTLHMVAGTGYAEPFVGATAPFMPGVVAVRKPRSKREKLGLTGWIASTGHALMANSAAELQAHPHWLGKHDEEQFGPTKRVHNFYGVPLQVAPGEIIGVLKVEGKRVGKTFHPFTRADAHIFNILATHVAIAISNARSVEAIQQQRAQLETITNALHKVVGALSQERPMQYLLDQIVATTADVLSAEACVLFLRDEEHNQLIERAGKGYVEQLIGKAKYELIPREKLIEHPERKEDQVGLTAWIAIKGEPFLARNNAELRAHPHWRGRYDKEHYSEGSGKQCNSFLGLPLKVGDKVLGVLKVENKKIGDQYVSFTDQDRRVFETLARSIAIAIGAVREQRLLLEQRITDAMYRVSQSLVGRFEIDPLLEEIVKTGKEIFGAEACVVFLVDEQNKNRLVETKGEGYVKQLEGKAEYHLIPREKLVEHPERAEDRVGLTAWIAITGQSFLARNNDELRAHPHWRGKYDKDHYSEEGGKKCESFLGLPLRVGDEVLGVLKVENKKADGEYIPFDERDEQIFRFLVNGAAIAIRNARDLRRIQETRQLEAIGRSAAAMAHRMGGEPLQSIRGAAHFLRQDLEKRGQAQPQNLADIRDIEKVVEEMTLAIDRVRDAAKPLKLTLNKCDISGLLRANFTDNRTFSEQFKKRGIQTELLGLEQLQTPDLMADESLLGEAFSYLVSNALDAISDGGRISIQVAEENQHLIIEFSDDGPGIDEKKTPYEKVFEPFFTTKKGGMGLGLFLVRRNIEAHGGTVNYIGKPKGACFRIKLLRGEHKEA